MPERHYFCNDESCGHTYEVFQSISEGIDRVCPVCNKETLFQDLSGIYGGVKEIKTVGQLADHNAKKFGSEYIAKLESERAAEEKARRIAQKERIERIVPGAKVPLADKPAADSQIPKLPKDVKKSIYNKTGEERQKRVKKYIMEGK